MPASFKTAVVSPVRAACALALWGLSVVFHDLGTTLSQVYFSWAETPGVLHAEGGRAGFVGGERLLQVLLGAATAGLLAAAAWRMRECPPRRLAAAALPWLAWAALAYAAWTAFIVFASELVHFVQYAAVGALLAWALGGRRPRAAFMLAVLLGMADELYQHYILHRWWLDDPLHWLDWSDPILNALGACGGILPFASRAYLRQEPLPPESALVQRAAMMLALLLLPLLLLDPISTTRLMGHYPHYPTWNEFANGKPVYWPQPRQGIPFFLAAVLVLGAVVRGGSRGLSPAVLATLAGLLAVGLDPPSRQRGQPVHEVVAETRVPQVEGPGIVVDGVLDEPAWAETPRLGPFVDLLSGAGQMKTWQEGEETMRPLQPTHARLLWDDRALYVGFEVEDSDLWARPAVSDGMHPDRLHLSSDEMVVLLIDDGGDEITYYSFKVTPAKGVADAFFFIPQAPVDYNAWNKPKGLPQWDARGLQTAVQCDGTLDLVASWDEKPASDRDRGYVVEMAIPWENFQLSVTPGGQSVPPSPRPAPGERWRLGLFRTEYYRLEAATSADSGLVAVEEAARHLRLTGEETMELVQRHILPPATPDSAFVWRRDVARRELGLVPEIQAWTPTYIASMDRPQHFGVVEFVGPDRRSKGDD